MMVVTWRVACSPRAGWRKVWRTPGRSKYYVRTHSISWPRKLIFKPFKLFKVNILFHFHFDILLSVFYIIYLAFTFIRISHLTSYFPHSILRLKMIYMIKKSYIHFSDKPQVSLRLGKSLDPDNLRTGNDVYFECDVRANPEPHKLIWLHNVSWGEG
jgi:hypothetical protein